MGKGKYTYTDGGVYEGDFKDDKMEGKSKYTYTDGGVLYEGDWENGKQEGKSPAGTCTRVTGRTTREAACFCEPAAPCVFLL